MRKKRRDEYVPKFQRKKSQKGGIFGFLDGNKLNPTKNCEKSGT